MGGDPSHRKVTRLTLLGRSRGKTQRDGVDGGGVFIARARNAAPLGSVGDGAIC